MKGLLARYRRGAEALEQDRREQAIENAQGLFERSNRSWISTLLGSFLDQFNTVMIGLFLTAFLALFAAYVLAHPGGLAGVIGTMLAGFCTSQGEACQYNNLVASFGVALVILTNLMITFIWVIFAQRAPDHSQAIEEMQDQLDGVWSQLYENKKHLETVLKCMDEVP